MSIFTDLGKESLSEKAIEQILDLLKRGILKPGDKLPSERDLSASMQISRAPLREALTALTIAGILETKAGSGRFIPNTFSVDNTLVSHSLQMLAQEAPFQILEARYHFEPEAAALAAKRATTEVLTELIDLMTIMEDLASHGDWIQKHDRDFHVTIARASQNTAIYNSIVSLCDTWFNEDTPWKNTKKDGLLAPERLEYICIVHREIYDCIANQDADGAWRAMKKNFDRVYDLDNIDNGNYEGPNLYNRKE